MNWRREAEQMLRDYPLRRSAIRGLGQELESLKDRMTAAGSPRMDGGMPRGERTVEDAWIDSIMRRDKLDTALRVARAEVRRTERGLGALSEQERHILELFYMHRTQDSVDRLMEELCLERSQVYAHKDGALRKFTLAMYGTLET